MKKKVIIIASVILVVAAIISIVLILKNGKAETLAVNLSNLTYEKNKESVGLKTYTQDEFSTFLSDYTDNKLPEVYVTEFLFDGVGMYKPYDLDDFVENGNDYEVKALEIKAININSTGDVELSGEITGGMLAINTNNVKKDINILLNGVKIDTDSKKVPAVLVYNKDITATDAKVTIKALENTKNYIEGGKLKKVSLVPSDELDTYTSKYTNTNKTNYTKYTNYYGIYTKTEIEKILFATIVADNEDLADGDPYYFYKASGAISSDIDLYFEGSGYLEVTSKNKEGIETKGNLTFAGGIGDYVINAEDDCLNTTTSSNEVTNARNTLTINVNSLYATVSNDADEGDAIDSNGQLIIDGGTIVAIAKPGQDAGIDSETGTYINGGNVFATGDMYDEVKSDSKQTFMVLSFGEKVAADDLITVLDSDDNVLFAYKTDRTYTNLVYSSPKLTNGTYYVYKNGTIDGEETNGYYTLVNNYTNGTQLGYTGKGNIGGMMGRMSNGQIGGGDHGGGANMNENLLEKPDGNGNPPEMPNGDMTPPDMNGDNNRLEMSNRDNNMKGNMMFGGNNGTVNATNKEFVIDDIANLFSGVVILSE